MCLKFGAADGANGTLKILQCSGCELVYYCSAACQHSDWKQHKPSCRKVDVNRCCQFCWIESESELTDVCGRCKKAKYCKSECKRLHWDMGHKKECKSKSK